MAHNPHAPQGPQGTPGNPDPGGSTQMFRAFVDEGEPQRQPAAVQRSSGGPKVGVIVGVVLVVVVLAVVAWLAFS
ncbi:hypothetical protein [Streptomyces sp. NBC_01497]|uniref:hypothetical protein n=1 Tax=Streptomyces sp. NBC_01497 TaxID=2903885 RepID=UPI002E2F791F|nr:hypothetical protein [Streptomyces sp. NBC_01497]